MSLIGTLTGLRVLESHHLTIREQVRFPRSKRRRIRKKWAKRPGNHASRPDPSIYKLGEGTLLMHPATAATLLSKLSLMRELGTL